MVAVLTALRKRLRNLAVLAAVGALAACDVGLLPTTGPAAGPRIDPAQEIEIALLVPRSDPGAASIAQALENAARLAIAERPGVPMSLRVYDTGGNAQIAAQAAQTAVDDGAQIILGPLFGEAANAAGIAVVDEGVNVLSFSNNPSIAGGNVYVLGPTFAGTASRLMGYARANGQRALVIVHSEDLPGQVGRIAIEQAAASNGIQVLASEGYPLSVEGVAATAQRARASALAGADTVFITTDATNAAMPMLLRMLPENGLPPGEVQYVGLTRWDVRPDLFSLPGAEGAWFAVPDQNADNAFRARYTQTYGTGPHPLAGLAYDGVAAIASLAAEGRSDALTARALTRGGGFRGATGAFRLLTDGTNQRSLAVASVRNQQVIILDPAPINFAGAGS